MKLSRILAAFGVAIAAILTVAYLPPLLSHITSVPATDRWQAVAQARLATVQLIVGFGALAGGSYAIRTFRHTRESEQNDRFSKMTADLASKNESVRTAGLHGLKILTDERPELWAVVEIMLCAFIKTRLEKRPSGSLAASYIDVQNAIRILGDRMVRPEGDKGLPLPLSGIDFTGFNLTGANLERATIEKSNFTGALLADAQLNGCHGDGANFDRAIMSGVKAVDAHFERCTFKGAEMLEATLTRVHVEGADFDGVKHITRQDLAAVCIGTPVNWP